VQYAEDETDVNNVEAWAELITHVLDRVPFDRRMQVLQLAAAREEAAIAERKKFGDSWEGLEVDSPTMTGKPQAVSTGTQSCGSRA
jgi:hypothetical protein